MQTDWVGTSSEITWPTEGQWIALNNGKAETDNDGGNGALDFVGDSTNPGFYYAASSSYVFFRMRLDLDVINKTTGNTPPNAAIGILIDSTGDKQIDYGFTWDTANYKNVAVHGLEMQVYDAAGSGGVSWGEKEMNDTDGDPATKSTLDINGAGRSGDGYIRSTDGLSSGSFGTTSLIDFAVKWSYLSANSGTGLNITQTWNITASTILTGNDHSRINGDIMGGPLTDTVTTSGAWNSITFSPIPEPTSSLVGILITAGVLRRRRE